MLTSQVNAIVKLRATAAGEIAITIASPFRGQRFSVDDSALTLTLWSEGADVIRGRFFHEQTQEFAYFQSNGPALLRLAELIRLLATQSE